MQGSLNHFERAFAEVGWFIPPYVQMGYLSKVATQILNGGSGATQDHLEVWLSGIYAADNLAAMVIERYPNTPVVCNYKHTIGEAVKAHFLGLHHIAFSGLVPVIEGIGRELVRQRGLAARSIKKVFEVLAEDCKKEVMSKNIGAVEEIVSMLNSFTSFACTTLYEDSNAYSLADKTNRHGALHGKYTDDDYGRPINFYKAIGAVDFLVFVSSFRAPISCFAPSHSEASNRLAGYFRVLVLLSSVRTQL